MSPHDSSVLMVAGEASGDLHASKVIARLAEVAPGVRVFGIGGERMKASGMELVYHADDFAMMGFVEVLRHIGRLRTALDTLTELAVERGVRLAVLVDYPGFNLALARRLKGRGVRVLYYISPQVWAWGERRVSRIARLADRLAVILPFEKRFYGERGVEAEFVGHPLLEEPEIAAPRGPKTSLASPPVLGLLPGSRAQEIERHLPPMLGAAAILRGRIPDLEVSLGLPPGHGAVPGTHPDVDGLGVRVAPPGAAHAVMRDSTALLVSSGTATLEAACFGTPMVVVYRMAPLSYALGRLLVRIPHIALVNVVAGEGLVTELIQRSVTPGRLADAAAPLLLDESRSRELSARLLAVRERLGTPGASRRVAEMASAMLEEE